MTTSDAFKAALWTAFFVFISLFGLSVLGWLNEVLEWAQDKDNIVVFPDASVLVKAFTAAAVSAIVGLVNFVVRWAQAKNVLPGATTAPTYR